MTPEQLVGLLALLADLRNQLAQVTTERDQLLAERPEPALKTNEA